MTAWMQVKKQFPDKLIAMQVGDFFEFAGWDTVMVIEALGLKGMGLGMTTASPAAFPVSLQYSAVRLSIHIVHPRIICSGQV